MKWNVWVAGTWVWPVPATVADVTRSIRSMPTKLKRKVIRLHPEVMIKLEDYKEFIHKEASPRSLRGPGKKQYRRPLSWNEFFMIIVSDWECSRSKCHCGHFNNCDHCQLLDEIGRRRWSVSIVDYTKDKQKEIMVILPGAPNAERILNE